MKIQNHLFTLVSQEPLWYYESCFQESSSKNSKVNGIDIFLLGSPDLCPMTLTFKYGLDITNDYHHKKSGDCKSNGSGDRIFLSSDFWSNVNFGKVLLGDPDLCPMALTFVYDLNIITGYQPTKFGDCNSNGSGDKNFCQVTFGPVWILVKSQTGRHTESDA